MANKMLIDTSHPEETRVVTVRGQKVEEFDFESANRKQLRGNIYLAKVTRVEPSLQAAFVEYGGNRHGFLAFSEIHPDYYQIPVADRQALLEAEVEAQREEEREEERRRKRRRRSAPRRHQADETVSSAEVITISEDGASAEDGSSQEAAEATPASDGESLSSTPAEQGEVEASDAAVSEAAPEAVEAQASESANEDAPSNDGFEAAAEADTAQADDADEEHDEDDHGDEDHDDEEDEDEEEGEDHDGEDDHEETVEQLGGDALEDIPQRPRLPRKQYKIQEVIKRRQVLLVQVVKEERGNKGAALTTYLSLAGRYSVLMPNTGRGGGISRKITNSADRKRLKEIAQELEVPEGMGIILRTAGASRTKPEIKRDYEYLMRLWESVRELTLNSAAPALVYEEGSLIKRAIRDLYNKDIDDILVSGEDGYREAKDFMRMLMPSHAKIVQPYRDPQPLFAKYGVEAQLDAMFSSHVTLKSGGYLVINPTEALVSIDVNSGRSTREHNIEDTALRTNLEAAEEIARQLRLRDLAGLIVIDFIDMEEKRNNRAVEKKLSECLKNDRARIQVGRISPFGLLEMSRQRIRTGVLESSSVPCAHCAGTGFVRSTPSVALHVLRSIEETLIKNAGYNLVVRTRMEAAFYILNQKRIHLRDLETRFGVAISIVADESLTGTTTYIIDRGEPALRLEHKSAATGIQIDAIVPVDDPAEADVEIDADTDEEETEVAEEAGAREEQGEESEGNGRRRRRRRRRRGRDREGFAGETREAQEGDAAETSDEDEEEGDEAEAVVTSAEAPEAGDADAEERQARRRRRGRRGGRGRGREEAELGGVELANDEDFPAQREVAAVMAAEEPALAAAPEPDQESIIAAPSAPEPEPVAEKTAEVSEPVMPEPEPVAVVLTPPDPDRPKRAGWWSKAKSVLSGS
jgi:ribonuclease E